MSTVEISTRATKTVWLIPWHVRAWTALTRWSRRPAAVVVSADPVTRTFRFSQSVRWSWRQWRWVAR